MHFPGQLHPFPSFAVDVRATMLGSGWMMAILGETGEFGIPNDDDRTCYMINLGQQWTMVDKAFNMTEQIKKRRNKRNI